MVSLFHSFYVMNFRCGSPKDSHLFQHTTYSISYEYRHHSSAWHSVTQIDAKTPSKTCSNQIQRIPNGPTSTKLISTKTTSCLPPKLTIWITLTNTKCFFSYPEFMTLCPHHVTVTTMAMKTTQQTKHLPPQPPQHPFQIPIPIPRIE